MNRIATLVAAAAFFFPVAAFGAPLETVHVAQGTLAGTQESGVAAFLGVPYAAPPVGDLRWKAPAPPAAWDGARQATSFAPSCIQAVGFGDKGFGPWTSEYVVHGAVGEDCLYLNVWTPAEGADAHLPVLFWIHGGGFAAGSGSVPIYDGAALAKSGFVVVTVNYRLGPLGFLALPALTAESPNRASGNYGLLDIVAALKWVKDNISAFGGDPSAVSIAGQSAGAMAVLDLDVSPLAGGLYARAISESGAALAGTPMPDLKTAEQGGVQFAQSVGADSLAGLRALPAAKLLANPMQGPRFFPIVDGYVIPDAPAKRIAEGKFNDTPFLTGLNADEASGMNPKYGSMTPDECEAYVARATGAMAARFAGLYLARSKPTCNAGAGLLARDRGIAGTYFWALARSKKSAAPTYIYLYDHVEPGPDAAHYGAFHSSEIPYVFRTLDASPSRPFAAADRAISDKMSAYWLNFVRTGNPNGGDLAKWPAFSPSKAEIMELGDRFGARPLMPATRLEAMRDYVAQGGVLSLF